MGSVHSIRRFARGTTLCTLKMADTATATVARDRARGFVRTCATLTLLALWSPLAWAVDLQLTNLSDDGSDPTPAGSVVTYSITLENAAADTAGNVRSVFDVPAGGTVVNLPAFCSIDAGDATRVVCAHGNMLGTLGGGAPVSFQLQVSTQGMPVQPISIDGAVGSGAAPAASVKVPAIGAPFISDTNTANNKESQTTTLTTAGDLQLTKTADVDPVVAGALITYTLDIRNNGPSNSTGFNVVDTLPSGATFVGPANGDAGWSFSGANATYGGTLAPGASTQYRFTARVTAAGGTIVNSAVVNAGTVPDPVVANNTDDVGTTVVPGADMEITKSASPTPATGGQPVTFTLNALNRGPSAAADVSFTDTMPAGFLITNGSQPAGWTCTTTADQTARTCNRTSNYAAGSSDTFTIEAMVPSSGQGSSGNQTNTATISTSTADPVPGNNTGSVTFTVLADGADLELASKTKSPGVVAAWSGSGDDSDSRMTSVIRVRNRGPRPATGQVQVADTLAAGEEFVSSSGSWACAAQSPYAPPPSRQIVLCSLNAGSLPLAVANGAGNPLAPALNIVTRAREAGTLTNTACTGGSGGSAEPLTGNGIDVDGNTTNDCTGAGVRTTTQRADLRIAKQTNAAGDADNTLPLGYTTVDFTLTVTNDGPNGTAGVVVNDQIPGFISGRSSATVDAPAGWNCNVGGNGSVQCRSNNTVLASGASAVLTLHVNGPLNDSAGQSATTCAGTTLSGIRCGQAGVGVDAAIAGAVGEINTTNNSASDWVRIPRVANVRTLSKAITSGAIGREGVNSVYRIDYDNQGPSAAQGVVFHDTFTLPANDAGFVMISADRTTGGNGSTACSIAAGAGVDVSSAAGGDSYSTPGASGTITVTCPALDMGNGVNESLTVIIRPNNQPGGSAGRHFDNVGDFTFTGASTGTDASGAYDYNSVATAADDQKTASLTFQANAVDLITNKVDTGFSGGVDPLGYDPTNPLGNVLTYRVTVSNQGPSVANNVRIRDTMTPIAGRTVTFLGTALTEGGALEGTTRCSVVGGSNPTTGVPLELDCVMPGVGFGTNVDGVVGVSQMSTLYLRYSYDTPPGATGDTVNNVAVASSDEADTQPGNNSEGENTSIRSRADVAVSKTMVLSADQDPSVPLPASVSQVSILQPFFYVIDVVNNGPGSSLSLDRSGSNPLEGTGTVVTDTLPAGVVVTGPITWRKRGVNAGGQEPNGTGQCTRSGNVVTCNLGDVTFDLSERGRVRILVPARWDSVPAGGTSNNQANVKSEQVDPVAGNNNVTVPLGVTSSSLAGTVFEDRQRDGTNGGTPQAAANEPRVANVTITLTGVDAYGNPVNRATTTDASGNYRFVDLAPSDASGYTITQTQPTGYVNGPVNPPAAGADAPSLGGTYDAGAPNSAYTAVVVGAADTAARYNFPEVRRPSLSGFVYSDDNFDNVRNPGVDAAIAGATVELLNATTSAVIATQTTNASGFYQFTDLDPAIPYTLREPLPAGNFINRPGAVNPGLIGGVACASGCVAGTGVAPDAATTDRIAQIDLSTGVGGTEFNFGEASNGASIAGRVWLDVGNDGLIDATEAGIAGVAVVLTGTDQNGTPANLTITTGPDGSYSFTGLVAGQYVVTEPTQPTGTLNGRTVPGTAGGTASVPAVTPSTITTIALGVNQAATAYNFGEIQPASVSGRVYHDHDDDGSVDAGETGIAGITITLTGTADDGSPVNLATTTDANGAYAFRDVRPGTYTVTEPTQPVNTTNGLTTPGAIGGIATGTATDRTVTPSAISGLVLPPGLESVDNNFGEIADSPDLRVSKTAVPATFTVGTDSGYTVRVRNGGNSATVGPYDVEDRLPAGVTLSATPTGTGWTCTGAAGADRFTCTSAVVIAQGAAHPDEINVPVAVSEAAAAGSPLVNAVIVRGGGETPARVPTQAEEDAFDGNTGALPVCDPATTQNACRIETPVQRGTSIGGRVFIDHNDNGLLDTVTETGIADVTLVLTGTDDLGQTVNLSTTTDADGHYAFENLRPGTYTVTEPTQPSNTTNGITTAGTVDGVATGTASSRTSLPSTVADVTLTPGSASIENNFAEIADSPDLLVSKAAVQSVFTVGAASAYTVSVRNAGNQVTAGEYEVEDRLPTGVTLAATPAGAGWTCVGAAGADRFRCTSAIVMASGQTHPGAIAVPVAVSEAAVAASPVVNAVIVRGGGETPARVPTQAEEDAFAGNTGALPVCDPAITHNACRIGTPVQRGTSIAGRVFFDNNDNGVIDAADEVGIADVTLVLTGTDDLGQAVNATVATDADGRYSFPNLRPGTYVVTEPAQPAGSTNGVTTTGTVNGARLGTATAKTVTPSAISAIVLAAGQDSIDNNFGEVADSPDLVVSKSVAPGILTVNNAATYSIRVRNIGPKATAGEYTIEDRLPTGVTLSATPSGNGWTCTGAVGESRLRCVTTAPLASGATLANAIAVPVMVSAEAATASTIRNVVIVQGGGEDAMHSPTADERAWFEGDTSKLPVCDPAISQNACRIETPVQRGTSIAGRAFFDNNDNGVIDAVDEVGIANIEIVLTGTDDLGQAVNVTVTTDADGRYRFPNLRPGTYVVTEPTQPPGSTNGVTTAGTVDGTGVGTATDKSVTPSAISAIVLAAGQDSIDNNFGEVADSPDLVVSKSVAPGILTVNNAATYSIRVRNIGPKATAGEYTIEDRLPTGVTLSATPSGNGWTCTGAVGESRLRCVTTAPLASGATLANAIAVPVMASAEAATASTIRNVVIVQGGGEDAMHSPTADERAWFEGDTSKLPACDPAISQNACRIETPVQAAASLSGTVWFDIGNDDVLLDGGDRRLQAWTVEVVDPASGRVVSTASTAADGSYRVADLVPGVQWNVRFRDPDSGALWGFPVTGETASGPVAACDTAGALANHHASSCRNTSNGVSQLEVVLVSGENLPQQSLPIDPSGVVYDAVTRDPVPNSVVTLAPAGTCPGFDPNSALLNVAGGGYDVEGSRVSMTVGADGFYQFLFGPSAPASCEFRLTVTPPSGYTFQSQMIAPQNGTLTPPGAVGSTYPVQPQSTPPSGAVGEATRYFLDVVSGSNTAGIIHNHIPLDPAVAPGLVISKTGDRQTVEVGDTLLYTITIRQTAGTALASVNVLDRLPPGFTYIDGTARANAAAIVDPLGKPGPVLSFQTGSIRIGEQIVLTYRVRVGVGSQQGDGINRAQAFGCTIAGGCIEPVSLQPRAGAIASNRAEYRVRVTGGVFTEEGCVLGKVFVDCNNNHVQDREELGVPGVRMYFEDGTWMVSDSEGKYSYCGLPPKSHTLKVDGSTLPVGSRLTTSSNRNLGDADSLFIDLKNGELHRADFIEGSCSNPVLEQVKARRTQGEVRAPESEAGQKPLRFDSKSPRWPQQGTDSSNQQPRIVEPRPTSTGEQRPGPDAGNMEAQP